MLFRIALTRRSLMIMIIIIIILATCSCGSTSSITTIVPVEISSEVSGEEFPTNQDMKNDCIPPLEKGAYRKFVDQDQDSPIPGYTLIVPPPSPWTAVEEMPEIDWEISRISLVVTRYSGDEIELWFKQKERAESYKIENADYYQYFIYQPSSKSWKTVPAQIENSDVFVGELFVSKDGSILGRNYWDFRLGRTYPLFSKFNEQTNSFEFIPGSEQVKSFTSERDRPPFYWSEVVLDSNDIFWILVNFDAVYSFDLSTNQVNTHASLEDITVSLPVINPEAAKIYFKDVYKSPSTNNEGNFVYLIETDNVAPDFPSIEPWPHYRNVLVGDSGRIWYGGIGWYDQNTDEWYTIHRSEIFITMGFVDIRQNRWESPEILLESSDSRVWYRTYNGIAWFDPETDEMCWITTYTSNIVEDADHNLWMIADDKLYKNPLND